MGNTFEINRLIHYRNSFLPVIKGQILSDNRGSKVDIKMRLHVMVYAFAAIWCIGVSIAFVAMLVLSIREGRFNAAVLIPLGMLIFLFLMTTGGFKAESGKARKDMLDIFAGQVEENNLIL